MEEITLLIADE